MLLIDRNDLGKYKDAIAKMAFLETYPDYKLYQDYKGSNCMAVENGYTNEISNISLLSKPSINIENYTQWYEKRSFSRYSKGKINVEQLSDEYSNLYREYLYKALIGASEIYYEIQKKSYKSIFDDVISDMYVAKSVSGVVYKYYGSAITKDLSCVTDDEKIRYEYDRFHRKNGDITFSIPTSFNDPFECDCVFDNGNSMAEKFRIFSSTEDNKNITMWGYYGSEHKGYCFEYSKSEIIKAVLKLNIDGICIYGPVSYKERRSKIKLISNALSYKEIVEYIDASFTKYKEWEYEKEYRFVILSNNFVEHDQGFTSINVPINKVYIGCKNQQTELKNEKNVSISTIKLDKDADEYRLVELQ